MIPKFVWLPVALLALGYAGVCGLMYLKQREMMYFPQFTRVDAAQTDFAIERDGVALRGWVVNPGKARAIVYFGGNGERIEGNREDFLRWFPDHSVYLVAYRGYGASDGQPSEQALLGDALAIFDKAQSQHPGEPVAVVGRSLGSGVASYIASQRPVAKLALITPFDSLAEVGQAHYSWLPVRWLSTDRYESARYLRKYRGALLVIRAGRDEVIPAASTDRLIESLSSAPQVVALPEAGHNDLDSDPMYGRALSHFIAPAGPSAL